MNVSAANLIKQSAKQLCFLRQNKLTNKATKKQLKGVQHQIKNSLSEYKEMRGCFEIDNFLIYFAFDEVIVSDSKLLLIEHKQIDGKYEEWYKRNSIIQTALYHQFALMQENKELVTATFYEKLGNPVFRINYENKTFKSVLKFGKEEYTIKPLSDFLVTFYIDKLKASLHYESAIEWDARHKHSEWISLREHIKYESQKKSDNIINITHNDNFVNQPTSNYNADDYYLDENEIAVRKWAVAQFT